MSGNPRDLDAQIEGLKSANLEALQRHWKSTFSKPCPSHLPRHLLLGMLAYRLQAHAHGDVSQDHKKYLNDVGRAASRDSETAIPKFSPESKRFKPGTVFVREHDGVEHRVVATPDGLLWGAETYSSLSAVARAITGTNWNGRRFFGLAKAGE